MNLPRNPVNALIGFPLGVAFTGAGLLVAGWAALAYYKTQLALDWMLWAIKRFDLRLTVPPEKLADDLIAYPTITEVFVALILFAVGTGFLRVARTAVRPADMSDDGKARITLKEELARAGRRLEGSVQLLKEPKAGEAFALMLSCRRSYKSGDDNKVETAFQDRQEAQPLQDGPGWSLPFRFEIPAAAPPSANQSFLNTDGYRWRLEVSRSKAWLGSPSVFDLYVAPATESDLRALEAREAPDQRSAIDAIEGKLKAMGRGPLLAHQREQLRKLSPEDLAKATKATSAPGKILAWIVGGIVLLFVVLPLLMFLIAAFFGTK